MLCNSLWKRGVRQCKTINPADTMVVEGGQEGCDPGAREEVSLQPMKEAMGTQAVSLQPMEVHIRAEINLQPKENSMLETAPGMNSILWRGAHAGRRFLAGLVTLWGNYTEEFCS